MLKLYHNDMSSCAQKVRFVLHEKALDWEGELLDLRRGDQLKPDFLKINPKGLVPALIHDGHIFSESNVIIEYLNDAFPEPPLLPDSAVARAEVRTWMKKLDDGLHLETIALSFGVAFRHQLIEACGSAAALEEHFSKIPDPYVQDIQRRIVPDGVESRRFAQAIAAFEQVLSSLDAALSEQTWIVGSQLTLADIAYAPYATRLEHLHLQSLWDDKPHVARWYAALKQTDGYKAGLSDWFNPKYLPLMDSAGIAAAPRIAEILSTLRSEA